jgi:uncharacterized protein (DUF2384 family)
LCAASAGVLENTTGCTLSRHAAGDRSVNIPGMTSNTQTPGESTAEDRARVAVRMATRAFGDGTQAANWLSEPSDWFDGHSPLFVATASSAGCARVCQFLDSVVNH